MDHEMEFEIRQTLNGVIGLAGVIKPFYDTLIKSEFTEPQALVLTCKFLECVMANAMNKSEKDD